MHQESQIVFTPGPTINFRSTRKLSSYLVRAQLHLLERTVALVSLMVYDVKLVTMLQKHRLSLESNLCRNIILVILQLQYILNSISNICIYVSRGV